MPVFRVEKNTNYTTMSNYHLRDRKLTLKAKGLLSLCLSLPETWDYSVRGLVAICKEGKDSIVKILQELEQYGYLERHQLRRDDGKMGGIEYVIYEMPREPCTEKPCAGKPDTDNPDAVKPDAGKPDAGKPDAGKPRPENPPQLNKKYRHNMEYGSARWGTAKDIEPFMAPKFEDNIILTKTERLMMSNRPKNPANARNKNVLIVGGSGSGKTRFWLKPNLLQMHSSYVVTDPKGSIVVECGNAMLKHGYRLKIFNTINFKKSMHYNPFAYIHSEKDILKLVTTLITNTKGDGKGGDPFWEKAETLLYTALIGYIHYEAPVEEQNFATLIEFINAMEVREDDETFENPVDLMFKELKKKDPNHFAVRQYAKFKLSAGDIKCR